MSLNDEQVLRYSRQIILPEVGGTGQEKILGAKVLSIGTGGLGSPVSMYLAAAGVGYLGVVDYDKVDESNLQRQILYYTEDVGKSKAQTAAKRLGQINPGIEIKCHDTRITAENVNEIIKDYDIIIDGSDNFPTRYLINDACYFLNKPLVHGAILRFEGRVMTIKPDESACYRCLFPEPPPEGFMPNCSQAGIIGAVAGVIGSLMAAEAIKLILNKGKALTNRMLAVDVLEGKIKEYKVHKDDNCMLCGNDPQIKELLEYEETCSILKSRE
jgi:thiazole biosynthesis adenylyltransferase ThiF